MLIKKHMFCGLWFVIVELAEFIFSSTAQTLLRVYPFMSLLSKKKNEPSNMDPKFNGTGVDISSLSTTFSSSFFHSNSTFTLTAKVKEMAMAVDSGLITLIAWICTAYSV